MLGHLRRSTAVLRRLQIASPAASDPKAAYAGWSSRAEASSSVPCWYSKHSARDFSTDDKITNGELKPSTGVKDNDAINDHIQKSTDGLKQGPVGHTLSSPEKRKSLSNTLPDLEDSKEAVYSTLNAWIAFEQDFPIVSVKQAIQALEKKKQWHRIVQVIAWMLSKGEGNTFGTYEQLVRALEKDNRVEEAHEIWEMISESHDLRSVPWSLCGIMLAIYYRNNRLDSLIKLFHDLEACGRKFHSKACLRRVKIAYAKLGLLEEKKLLLDKYKDLYKMPPVSVRKEGRQFKKTEKKSAEGTKQCEVETSEDLPINTCPSDKELTASNQDTNCSPFSCNTDGAMESEKKVMQLINKLLFNR